MLNVLLFIVYYSIPTTFNLELCLKSPGQHIHNFILTFKFINKTYL